MTTKLSSVLPFLLIASILNVSCEAIGSIFKAGMWTGMIGVILLLALIIFIVAKIFSKNKNG